MLCHMSHASQIDANGTPNRIFQERTNFKNLQGHNRLGVCTEESIPRGGATQQENGFVDIPRRRKSQRKMLRSPLIPNSNVLSGAVDVVLPTQELSPTTNYEVLHGPVESVQDPISRQARMHPTTQPSQRVRADHALLSDSYDEAKAEHTLKVAALTRVTSSLAAKASDAKQGVERLRKLLADRAVEPSIYEATQRERWMEEQRQVATEELLKTVRDHLASVVKSPALSLPQSTPTTEGEEEVSSAAANLHIFLTSPHRHAIRPRRRRPHPASLPEDAFNRIRHHKQLLPLRLKVPVHRPFSQPPPKAPTTGTENPSSPVKASALTEPTITNTTSPPSSSNATLHPFPSPAPALDAIPENQEGIQCHLLQRPQSPGNRNGTATIWRAVPLRSKEEILADMDMDTNMPDYVQNLLAELDSAPVARVRLNSLRRSASFPRRPASPVAVGRTPKRNSHANASSSNTKRNTMTNTPVASNPSGHSLNMSSSTPTNIDINTTTTPHIHSSPSRRRLSTLFSVPEMLSSRRSMNIIHSPSHPPHPPQTYPPSAQLPALALVSPSIGFTIMESSQENEEEEIAQEPAPEQQPSVVPIPPSTSAITLSSVGTVREARGSSFGVNTEEKVIARLRRRMSSALGRQ